MHYHAAEIALYEIGLSKSPQLASSDSSRDFKRLELLYACLQATNCFFEIFFSIPAHNYFSFSVPTWSHLTSALISLQLLSTFDHPDWSLVYVRETLDFLGVLDRLIEQLSKAQSEFHSGESPVLARTAQKIRRIKAYCEGKMIVQSAGVQSELWTVQNPEMAGTAGPINFLDESSLRDILGLWDYPLDTDMD
jgi:hypothetical protein